MKVCVFGEAFCGLVLGGMLFQRFTPVKVMKIVDRIVASWSIIPL
jgi:hypothetical protein